jgi:dihydroorotate dehydrogenase subfamily 2
MTKTSYQQVSQAITGLTYRNLAKPLLFRWDPESVHDWMTSLAKNIGSNRLMRQTLAFNYNYNYPSLQSKVEGIKFDSPVGLSAGFDKDGYLPPVLANMGFGFQQVGSVTLHPYKGNDGKRLVRLPKSKGIVVNYGLKNEGVKVIAKRLKHYKDHNLIRNFPLSISVAKTNNKEAADTEQGIADYIGSLKILEEYSVGDIYTINVSCPNTFGGEPYTSPERFKLLVKAIAELNLTKPVWVKLPLNIDKSELTELIEISRENNIDGAVLSNLQKDRSNPGIVDEIAEGQKGSISGKPTSSMSTELIKHARQVAGNDFTIVGVGGIFSAEDAWEKLAAGSNLVQLITGLVYQGPQLVSQINRGLNKIIKETDLDKKAPHLSVQFRS